MGCEDLALGVFVGKLADILLVRNFRGFRDNVFMDILAFLGFFIVDRLD